VPELAPTAPPAGPTTETPAITITRGKRGRIVHSIDGSWTDEPRPLPRSELSADYLESQQPTRAYAEELRSRGELGGGNWIGAV